MRLYVCRLCMDIICVYAHMQLYEYGQVCYVRMVNLVSMSVDVYLYM